MAELHLLVLVGGRRAAIPGSHVHSVVEIDQVVPVPLAPAHVAGLTALRSRALTVIDARAALGLDPSAWETEGRAAVTEIDGHGYAVLVDRVEDVAESLHLRTTEGASLGPEWDRIALGLLETTAGPAVLVDLASLVAGPPVARPRAA